MRRPDELTAIRRSRFPAQQRAHQGRAATRIAAPSIGPDTPGIGRHCAARTTPATATRPQLQWPPSSSGV